MTYLKYILAGTLLVYAFTLVQAVEVPSVLKERSRAAKLPPTDTAILYHGTTITVYADGRMDREEQILRYLRNDNAWDDYGDPHLSYDASRQDLNVQISRVHTMGGRQIDTTPNGFNPIVPFGLDLAPDFTRYRQMVVTHLGIDPDAVTELKYTISDKKPLYPWVWGEILFGTSEPILERTLIVRTEKELQVSEENGAPAAKQSRDGNWWVYTWTIKDLIALNSSEAGAKPRKSLPKVAFSSCPDWATLSREISSRLDQSIGASKALNAALEPLKKITNPEQRLDSLIAFIKNRLVLKSFDDPGMQLSYRATDRIFTTGYGSNADFAALYLAALMSLDLKPELYFACGHPLKVPGFSGLEKYLLRIKSTSPEAWLYPAEHRLSYRAPDQVTLTGVYPVTAPQAQPVLEANDNSVRLEIQLNVKDDRSATGWILIHSKGAFAQYDQARSAGAEELVNGWLLGGGDEVENARLTSLLPYDVVARADLKYESLDDTLGNFLKLAMFWQATDVEGLLPDHLALNLTQRDFPLFLEHTGSFEIIAQVNYPPAWSVGTLPKAQTLKAEGISLDRSVKSEKGSIHISEKVTFDKNPIPVQNWNAWRNVLLAAYKSHDRTILLDMKSDK